MAAGYADRLPEAVRKRVAASGEPGRRWQQGLDETVARLAERWQLRIDEILADGSESLVLAVRRADGGEAVLKLCILGVAEFEGEARTYQLAKGRGVALRHAASPRHGALLLERLGASVARLDWPVAAQIDAICAALKDLWQASAVVGLMTGAEKARWLADFIDDTWQRLASPCAKRTRGRALDFAAERADAHTAAASVLVHGDAHAHNTLIVPGFGGAPGSPCKLVDPDGLFAEPACDLAVPMREWSEALRPDPVRLARERCGYLAESCATDERAIWQWGFMERVSTGLHLLALGFDAEGREMLEIADRLAGAAAPS